jgi:diadenylate cyclase
LERGNESWAPDRRPGFFVFCLAKGKKEMFWHFFGLVQEIGWKDVLDIGLASILLWLAIDALRRSRLRFAGVGLLAFGALFLIARELEIKLTVWILQGLAALIVLILIIVFQNEIRLLLERLSGRLIGRRTPPISWGIPDILCEGLNALSKARRGALVVLPSGDPLEWYTTEGIPLNGQLTLPLLLSIFDPNSPGHDGALIVEGSRIERFGVHLPLSNNTEQLQGRGTRHAAALGLSEKTDALVLVVSEETGRVSAARNGTLRPLARLKDLQEAISGFFAEQGDSWLRKRPPTRILRKSSLEGILALFLALVLWLVLVPGAEIDTLVHRVPIKIENVPADFTLKEVVPAEVAVTLAGPRRKLFLFDPANLSIPVDITLARFGRQTFSLTRDSIQLPRDLEVAEIRPSQIKVLVETKP